MILKSEPHKMYFKTSSKNEPCGTQGKRPKPAVVILPKLYKTKLPITAGKKKDLVNLCDTGIVPEEHHDYYRNLYAQA